MICRGLLGLLLNEFGAISWTRYPVYFSTFTVWLMSFFLSCLFGPISRKNESQKSWWKIFAFLDGLRIIINERILTREKLQFSLSKKRNQGLTRDEMFFANCKTIKFFAEVHKNSIQLIYISFYSLFAHVSRVDNFWKMQLTVNEIKMVWSLRIYEQENQT